MSTEKIAVKKNRHAVALGRKGGIARAENLTAKELSEIGRKGGLAGGRGRFDKIDKADQQVIAGKGGLQGGRARAEKLTPERRREIAKAAAAARWGKTL